MSWRKRPDDPRAECQLLGVATAVANLGWTDKRLLAELEASDTAGMFKGRVRNALQRALQREADAPRLLARDSSHGYVDKPYLALADEPEAVPREYQDDVLTADCHAHARAEWQAERIEILARIAALKANPALKSTQGQLRVIERQLAVVDRRVRRLPDAA